MKRLVYLIAGLIAYCMAALLPTASHAASSYPSHPIRMLVGQSPGSATDVIARLLAQKMSQILGQSIIVENSAGAGGVVAASTMAHASPDGYYILMTTASQISLAPHLMQNLPYKPFRDFTYIAPATDVAMLLVASPQSGITDFKTLLARAKAAPGKINFASSGLGSASHLALEMVAQQAHISLTHVPYKGTGPAITSILANDTSLLVNALGSLETLVKAGKLVPLVTLTDDRNPQLPDVPSLPDVGLKIPHIPAWVGLIGPAKMPQPIVDKLAATMRQAIAEPDVQQKFNDLGFIAMPGDGAAFKARAEDDSKVWGKLIHDRNIHAE